MNLRATLETALQQHAIFHEYLENRKKLLVEELSLDTLKQRCQETEEKLLFLEIEKQKMEKNLGISRNSEAEFRQTLKQWDEECKALQASLENLRQKESELQKTNPDISYTKEELNRLGSQLTERETELRHACEELQLLKKQEAKLRDQLLIKEGPIRLKRSDIKDLKNRIAALQEKLNYIITDKRQYYEDKIRELQQQIEAEIPQESED